MVQLLVLAGIAVFLILRLRSVLGTREGFEKPVVPRERDSAQLEVIDGGAGEDNIVDFDVAEYARDNQPMANALKAMKQAEPDFRVAGFLSGAKGAYEMILMSFERGALDDIKPFVASEVFDAFEEVVSARKAQGVTIDAEFIGVRETALQDATFDNQTGEAELTVRFVGELTSVVRDTQDNIVEGDPKEIKRQKDVWTFARHMGSNDPNWQLVATGD